MRTRHRPGGRGEEAHAGGLDATPEGRSGEAPRGRACSVEEGGFIGKGADQVRLSRPFSASPSAPVSVRGRPARGEGALHGRRPRPRPAPVIPPLPLHVLWFVSRKMLFESGMVFNKKRATGITKNLGKETYGRHISASRGARYHVPSGTRYSYGPVSAAEVPNADDAKCWGGREAAGRNGHPRPCGPTAARPLRKRSDGFS